MDVLNPDYLNRTTKLELDEGRARSFDEAHEIVARYVLQIDVGSGIIGSETRQAMLLTTINAARRAFIGGVRVRLHERGRLSLKWAKGLDVAEVVETYGGEIVESLESAHPTLVIGNVDEQPPGSIVLYTTWEGWAGGVVTEMQERLAESLEFPLAGMLAAALGVSETFQNVRGDVVAGRRSTGLSLWAPQYDWRSEPAHGEPCRYLPDRLWLLGLGHLGQAYAWGLGLLPYDDHATVTLVLQDYDTIVKANKSTGMLSNDSSVGQRKSRVVATCFERLGFKTAITERPFNDKTRRDVDEPGIALVGVDSLAPRRLLENANFDLVVDAGLGGGPRDYLDILIHSFPSGMSAETAWPEKSSSSSSSLVSQPAYLDLQRQLSKTTKLTDGEIECGIIEVAGRSAGAAFVGCVAAAFVLSEVLRVLAGGPRFEVLDISLRSPHKSRVAHNACQGPLVNPGFVTARPPSIDISTVSRPSTDPK